ncbi:TetR family transcriptional regulator [Gordonia shandongensis]|uniref:TetR family transcriptional regulator n=1 Tax=Gordonia shandongensis TaxID=376351 RepID=UPI00054E21C6|nr:TetR family transcriptional regulator [Gordonia shandongensis]
MTPAPDSPGTTSRRSRSKRPRGESVGSRAEKKEQTRQALLDTTIDLVDDRSFGSISLREVARGAGIVPTAFYRHFASMEDLGVTLVEDAMRVLRGALREARRDLAGRGMPTAMESLSILLGKVRADESQFRFLVREQHGGVAEVRRAIGTELRLFSRELAIDLARVPELAPWEAEDLEVAADLIVAIMMTTVAELLDGDGRDASERLLVERAEKQLVMVFLGMNQWRPRG